jgi:hypothetical protein
MGASASAAVPFTTSSSFSTSAAASSVAASAASPRLDLGALTTTALGAEAAALALWEPAPGVESASFAAALESAAGHPRLVAALVAADSAESAAAAAAACGFFEKEEEKGEVEEGPCPWAVSVSPLQHVPSVVPTLAADASNAEAEAEAAAAEAAVFVAMRAAALARAGLRVSPASFLRASLVRLRVEAAEASADAPPPCFTGLPASAVAAAIELGRFRYRWCRAQQRQLLLQAPQQPAPPPASPFATRASHARTRADVARKPTAAERAQSEEIFARLASREEDKIHPEVFIENLLLHLGPVAPGAGGSNAADAAWALPLQGRWRALALAFNAADLDEDGRLDLPEAVIALRLVPIAARLVAAGEAPEEIQRLLVVPPSAVPVAKRALALKREVALRRVKRIFLSYRWSRESEPLVHLIKEKLVALQYEVFLDVDNLGDGNILRTIETELPKCQAVVPVLTKDCYDRCVEFNDAVLLELRLGLGLEHVVVVPFRLRNATDYGGPALALAELAELQAFVRQSVLAVAAPIDTAELARLARSSEALASSLEGLVRTQRAAKPGTVLTDTELDRAVAAAVDLARAPALRLVPPYAGNAAVEGLIGERKRDGTWRADGARPQGVTAREFGFAESPFEPIELVARVMAIRAVDYSHEYLEHCIMSLHARLQSDSPGEAGRRLDRTSAPPPPRLLRAGLSLRRI